VCYIKVSTDPSGPRRTGANMFLVGRQQQFCSTQTKPTETSNGQAHPHPFQTCYANRHPQVRPRQQHARPHEESHRRHPAQRHLRRRHGNPDLRRPRHRLTAQGHHVSHLTSFHTSCGRRASFFISNLSIQNPEEASLLQGFEYKKNTRLHSNCRLMEQRLKQGVPDTAWVGRPFRAKPGFQLSQSTHRFSLAATHLQSYRVMRYFATFFADNCKSTVVFRY